MEPFKLTEIFLIALFFFIIDYAFSQGYGKLHNKLLLSEPGMISEVNFKGSDKVAYAKSPSAVSIDYDCKRNSLVWSDKKTNQIYTLADESTEVQILIPNRNNWTPFSISVDFIRDKLYVVDTITDTVQIYDLKNLTKHGIVVGSNITKLKSIALDPYEGYLFILDQYQILRTDLDGSNPKVLYFEIDSTDYYFDEIRVTRDSISLANIALDFKTKRLYWINTNSRNVQSSDYNGSNLTLHYQAKNGSIIQRYTDTLTFLNNQLYWSDDISKQLFKLNLNKEKIEVAMQNVRTLFIKSIICTIHQEGSDPCNSDNGQCQHLCLSSRSNKESITCSCNVGYQLDKDGKSWITPRKFLFFEQGTLLRGKSLNADGYISADVIDPSKFKVGSMMGLDFDATDGLIFYSSSSPKDQLHLVRLGNGNQTILLPDLLSNSTGKIAYDWTTKNLYYFTHYYSDMITLSVVNVNNPTYSKILIEDVVGSVRAIVAHPNRGYIYYVSMNRIKCSISRINSDGSGLKTLQNLNSEHIINGLAVDYNQDRIYWTESMEERDGTRSILIRHCNLDGKDIRDLLELKSFEGYLATMTIYKDWIYLNSGSILYRLNKTNGENLIILLQDIEMSQSLSSIKVFNSKIQNIEAGHPCANNIKTCQKFCFAVQDTNNHLKGLCGCPYGEKLGQDGKSCIDNSQNEPPFLPCKNFPFKCKKSKPRARRS